MADEVLYVAQDKSFIHLASQESNYAVDRFLKAESTHAFVHSFSPYSFQTYISKKYFEPYFVQQQLCVVFNLHVGMGFVSNQIFP